MTALSQTEAVSTASHPIPPIADSPHAIQRHSKSFSLASKLLPYELRRDAHTLYAWCRRADDTVDLAESKSAAENQLRLLFSELDEVYSDTQPNDPTLLAFQDTVRRNRIPRLYPQELLLGMQMDTKGVHYQTQDDLMLYCYRVAGTVGLMMCHVLGLSRQGGLIHAAHMGMGMQLTNICRDVKEDFERHRVYLPQAVLDRHSAGALTIGSEGALQRVRDPLRAVLGEQLALAERYYASGDMGLDALEKRSRFAISSARSIYSAIGTSLKHSEHDVLAPRAYVPTFEKMVFLLKNTKHLFQGPRFRPCSALPELRYEQLAKL